MKLLLLFLITLIPCAVNPVNAEQNINPVDSYDNFMHKVNSAYEKYAVYEQIDTEFYTLTVVQGICNEKPAYGVFFTSNDQKYHIVLNDNGLCYSFSDKLQGQVDKAIVIYLKSRVKIEIVNADGKRSELLALDAFTVKSFENTANTIKGENLGSDTANLYVYKKRINFIKVLIIVMASVCVLSFGGILFLYTKRKGLFDKNKRSQGVINMRELLKEDTKDNVETNDYYQEPEVKEEKVEEITDIKAYLRDKGYITEYQTLTEEDKNRIMLELIKLKNEKKITLDRYYEETSELWKK